MCKTLVIYAEKYSINCITTRLKSSTRADVVTTLRLNGWCQVVMRPHKADIFITRCYIQTGGTEHPHGLVLPPINTDIFTN